MESQPTHESLERDIIELSNEIRRHTPETSKDALKSAIGERIESEKPSLADRVLPPPPAISQNQKTDTSPKNEQSPLPNYAKDVPAEARLKVEELIDLAWHKGLSVAIRKVKKTDPLTMDIFHDAITEKLYEEFKKRGIIK